MWFKSRAWIPIAWVLSFANAIFVLTVGNGQPAHAAGHALLAILFAFGALRLSARQGRDPLKSEERQMLEDLQTRLGELTDLQRRVVELEDRVDFAERVLAQRREGQRLGPPQG
ncbi:MAG TPA: hypothetical protein VH158_09690 [Gemmatimonadales bacterium]|nr:hypothetical protein [Gemmatimonadales bacterium]